MSAGAMAGGGLLSQFRGGALYSIGVGLLSVIVPLVTDRYFPILPVAGAVVALNAIRKRAFAGGVIGLVINLVGIVIDLFAIGLIGGG
jgi:hypothetical protein